MTKKRKPAIELLPGSEPHYWPGKGAAHNTAIMLGCPGKHEERKKHPAANSSGTNLNIMLEFLNKRYPAEFPTTDRFGYIITNAHKAVLYDGKDPDRPKKTMPDDAEIREEENIKRLMREIGNCSVVLALSPKACLAVEMMRKRGFKGRLLRGAHPSLSHINREISEDINGAPIKVTGRDANRLRLEVLASRVIEDA